ncbi:YkvA family protein [Terrabacter sp. GCM10028922]|uniref:YkvA family protein n=1 Tax=Terrabacter sp. GCM10028922 TaxID=3273428 RepID=UPI00361FE4B5
MKSASRIKMAATIASVVRASTRPGAPSLSERVHAVPRLVRSTVDGTYAGTTMKRLALVAGAVVYVASPVDLLPEAVLPVLGAADDAVVISWAIKAFVEETDRFIAWEIGQGIHRAGAGAGRAAGWGRPAGASSAASRATVRGSTVGSGGPDVATPARAGGADEGLRRDRDLTGAAGRGRLVARVSRVAGGASRPGAQGGLGSRGTAESGPGRPERIRLPEGMRQAATDYVLETVRKRLER